ncbi:MAG TPA: L-ribulose-5-phosphate 4-epimerase AraD [Solirubrobacteraceae bacterium]|nr:L-ribulose-5-phosphate 4-epimerase AraD [Solirubrobacteraceae bacterium]
MSGDPGQAAQRLSRLRAEVLAANLALPASGLVTLTWGNASAIDRDLGLVAIKPSGVDYDRLTEADLVVLDLEGNLVEGESRPSTDTPTHLALYRAFPAVGAVVHTHSTWATAWAQAEHEIPPMGTTHADLSPHAIPLTRPLTEAEIETGYEAATGAVLIEAVTEFGPAELPCALVRQHGPFCWGRDCVSAVVCAVTLEEVARLASLTMALKPLSTTLDPSLRNKHYERKHGPRAYYGQAQ